LPLKMSSKNQFNIEKIEPQILQDINEIDARISRQENSIIIIGETREGKTTLFNYLVGNSLFSKKNVNNDEFDIYSGVKTYIGDSLNNIEIKNGSISQTSLPLNQGEYWDCPGFGDSRGDEQNIINAYSIYMLTKNIEKLKVLVVVSENTIIERSKTKFLNLIQYLGEIFKNNNDLVKGLCLVVTQSEKLDLKKVRNRLRGILIERGRLESFSLSQRKILGFLSSDRSQIAFFNAPREEGLISDKDKYEILDCIKKISYIENLEPSFSLRPEAVHFIKDLIEVLYNDIEVFMSKKFYSALRNYVENLIDNHNDTFKKLRESLNELVTKVNAIISDTKNPQEFEDKLRQVLSIIELLRKEDLKDELQKKISQLNLIKLVKTESISIQGNTSSWYHLINELINAIRSLMSEPTINCEGNILTFKGAIIGTEDIAETISHKDYKEINVYSLNTIFIDKDIEASGAFLTFISPQLRVVGKRTINLKGKAGPPHNPGKAKNGTNETSNKQDTYDIIDEKDTRNEINEVADSKTVTDIKIEEITNEAINGKEVNDRINNDNIKKASIEMHGKDGLRGLPGYNGGHFYAEGRNFINLSSLTIDISGGDGGKGQDGGDGTKGRDGDFKVKEMAESRNKSALVLRTQVSGTVTENIEKGFKFLFTFNEKWEETYEAYDPGQEGGNGGRGGVGGNVGRHGTIYLNFNNSLEIPTIIKKNNRKGIDGKGGSPGYGGKNAKYSGIYINEIVFSLLR
ncbi:1777_t:CDS:1, partial [Racocetra fulgida]